MRDLRTPLAYAGMCLIWGTTYLVIKQGLHGLSPLAGVGVRFILAGLVFAAVALAARRPRERVPLGLVVTLATGLFGLNYVFVYVAETRLASGMMAVLFAVYPFCMYAFGRFLLGEQIARRALAGTAVAVIGVVMLSWSLLGSAPPFYVAAALCSPVLAAFANVRLKESGVRNPLNVFPQAMLLAGAVSLAAGLASAPIDVRAAVAPSSLWSVVYLTLFGTCIAFTLNLWVLRHLSAGTVGLSQLIVPTVALIVGAIAGGESLSALQLCGASLVIGGVAAAVVPSTAARPRRTIASATAAASADRCA